MKNITSVLIVGLGAIGTIYATKLHAYDPRCVRVLVDERRRERLQRDGVLFNGQRYDFNYVLPDRQAQKADLILIATKSSGLRSSLDMLAGYVGVDTLILSLMNGITSEAVVAETFGWDKVLYSLFIGHVSTRHGNAVAFDGTGTVVFGEAKNPAPISERVAAVRDLFDRAGIDYQIPPDMLFALWRKFMINVGFNQASAVLGASYGVFQQADKALGLAKGLMQEVVVLARCAGIDGADAMLASGVDMVATMPPAGKSSMLQDVEAGRATEVDLFARVVCDLGRQYQVPTPLNAAFLAIIEAIDQKNARLPAAEMGG